jgi:Domain of unknown function (DUF4123)
LLNTVPSSVDATEIDFARLKELAGGIGGRLYAVLDACEQPLVPILVKQLEERAASLYRGKAELEHAAIAPYLISVDIRRLAWIQENLWGQAWGFFAAAQHDLVKVRTHFRKFLMVDGPEGKELYFRFYDPRVLQPFLESADASKVVSFYGPVDVYVIVDGDGLILEYKPKQTIAASGKSASKLAFSTDDVDSYADARRGLFAKRLYGHVSNKLKELGQRFQAKKLEVQVDRGILRALSYEMNAQCDIARYVEVLCIHGNGIEGDRDRMEIEDILFDRRVSWSERLDRLELHCRTTSPQAV